MSETLPRRRDEPAALRWLADATYLASWPCDPEGLDAQQRLQALDMAIVVQDPSPDDCAATGTVRGVSERR